MGLMLPILLPTVMIAALAELFSEPLALFEEVFSALQIVAMQLFG